MPPEKSNSLQLPSQFFVSLGDKLDDYLSHLDDPQDWRKLPDFETPITREELDIIYRLQQGNIADITFDPYSVGQQSIL